MQHDRTANPRDSATMAPHDDMSRAAFLRLLAAGGASALLGGGAARAAEGGLITRPIPSSGAPLPVVGLGTWLAFDVGASDSDRAAQKEVLTRLVAGGGSVIDSSPMYGRAEQVVGDLLSALGTRDQAFIATKVWTRGRDAGIAQMEQSFRRFRTDRIDLMQIHNLVDWETHLPTLREWKAAGRFRYLGITHYTSSALPDLARVLEQAPFDFVQLAYSIGVRDAEQRVLPLAAERGVAVLVNRPYERGALFRAVRDRPLPLWAADFDCASWGQFFLKFILGHPAVTCVIPGTSKPKHMADNLGAGRGALPDAGQRKTMLAFWESL